METILLIIIILLLIIGIVLQFVLKPIKTNDQEELFLTELEKATKRIEAAVKEEVKTNRQELAQTLTSFQQSFISTLSILSKDQSEQLKGLIDSSQQAITGVSQSIGEQMVRFTAKTEENNRTNREELSKNLKAFSEQMVTQLDKISLQVEEKLGTLNSNTEKKLEQMRETVDEKLQKTLNERLGQSFAVVSRRLESVQKGLGEMQTLAQDVGGLKKVLSNVKLRGGLGEVRL